MDHGRAAAVHEIRRAQKHARQQLGLADIAIEEGVLDAALEAAGRREQAAVVKGDRVRESALSYPLELEKKRWARTRDIIHRVAPGPNEDARYLEMALSDKPERACEGCWSEAFRPPADATRPGRQNGSV
jgi:hypothetical protein